MKNLKFWQIVFQAKLKSEPSTTTSTSKFDSSFTSLKQYLWEKVFMTLIWETLPNMGQRAKSQTWEAAETTEIVSKYISSIRNK